MWESSHPRVLEPEPVGADATDKCKSSLSTSTVYFKGTRQPYRTFLQNGEILRETPPSKLPPGAMVATREENGGIDTALFMA